MLHITDNSILTFNNSVILNMTVSLLITTYNRPDALEAVLVSVEHQSLIPNQVVVADDGSTESTKNVIDKYKLKWQDKITLLHSWHPDKGFRLAETRNRALSLVDSEYVIIIDGDMLLEKHFVYDHVKHSKKGFFIQGGRMLLTEEKTKQILKDPSKPARLKYLSQGVETRLEKRLTGFRSPFLTNLWKKESHHNLKAIRGCNMSFYYQDILLVNGYNNEFVGWGREDSEFVVRLFNTGIKRHNIKFSAIAYHLYHKEEPRDALPQNDLLLKTAIEQKLVYCNNGIREFLK